ncbi:MAG TPA: radical SAM protein [Gemmataceae bacterium]|nr:radical SAM protein [Gemmataceae bacterium]
MFPPPGQPVRVGLVQINNSFSGQNYLPYSVGMLQAYVQGHAVSPTRYEFLLPIYRRVPVREAVEQLRTADVVGFSTYVWNIRLSLAIAQRLKEQKPETLIVFGGPQVPDRAEAFLRRYPFIDLACHGEGEAVFLQILERYPDRNWDGIGSISYLRDGTFVNHPRAPRIGNLAQIPSPYLEGVFAPLMKANPAERWLVLWETNRGCPFSCTFCDWGSATAAKVYQFDLPRLFREVEWFAEHQIEFVFCCDANFGMLARDLDLVEYVAQVKKERGYPQALSVQNTKNATEKAYRVQKRLADAGLNKGVTISLQSVHAPTLQAIRRQNISSASFQELQRRFTRDGVETYTDLILGLPGETYDSFADGVAQVIANGQHNRIQFNNLSVLPNAEMGDPEYQKRYGLVTVRSKIINIHGSLLESEEEVQEYQELVVATASMPAADWVRTRVFCWITALLHFDKVLQIPLVVIHETCKAGYRELLELFSEGDLAAYPVLRSLREFFRAKAIDIQQGGEEYCRSERWLNIYWPADELALIHLCTAGQLTSFYQEAEELLGGYLRRNEMPLPARVLRDAVRLNQALLKLPFQTADLDLEVGANIWEFYRAALEGRPIPLEESPRVYHIDRTSQTFDSWEEWCRQVIWYGNKKGAYLYTNQAPEPQLEGHF